MKKADQGQMNKSISIQDEEVIVNMRMNKGIYDNWKRTAEFIGVDMVHFLEVLIMYCPHKKIMLAKWPWYAGYPEEWEKSQPR